MPIFDHTGPPGSLKPSTSHGCFDLGLVLIQFFAALRTSLAVGRYFLCHAGVRPGVPLERQTEEDLLWIREPFLDSPADHGAVIVHGHSIATEPQIGPSRIGIDTGAFATGRLTALVLEGEERRFLHT